MKNINEKESLAESDLEEGEIPEFEVCKNADSSILNVKEDERNQPSKKNHLARALDFGRVNDGLPPSIHNPLQAGLMKNPNYFPSEKGRYELSHVEGDYVSEEPKSVVRNQVLLNTFYDYNSMERRLKHLHPFQTTYGSVEHIMTKIGETLGRSNDCYYKGRRSNDHRSVIKLNNNIGATFRESGSLFRRFRNNYRKRRRCSQSNSDSDRDIWESKFKNRNSTGVRRKEEKDFKKKRKTKCSYALVTDGETKKYKLPEKSGDPCDDSSSIKPNLGGNERLLKAIRVLQEREYEAAEVQFAEDDSKADEKDGEKSVADACVTVNSDDNQENRNYEDFSEKSSTNEDSDDDVELIKLRLLALTSNKRKNQVSIEEKLNDEKIDENPKTEDEKKSEDSQISGECRNSQDNDIDRYELMLRAEALKTALLKKHKHGIKKRKFSSVPVTHDDGDGKVLEKQESELILSQEDTKTKVENFFSPDAALSIVTVPVSENEAVHEIHADLENKLVNSGFNVDLLESSVDPKPVSETDNKTSGNCLKGNHTEKKTKKRRLKKNRRLGELKLNELRIKENSRALDGDDQKAKVHLPDSISQKKTLKECEKKFVLVDSSQLSKVQSTDETKLSLDVEQSAKNIVPAKTNDAISTMSTLKIPEIERIIVHLGSESSDEEALTHNNLKPDGASPKEPENIEPPCTTSGDVHSKITDYEKSVELLLKDARRRIEQNMETPQRIPPTPEAVYNHLAPSQRLEYLRLKQKIAETEKLRKMKENMRAPRESPTKNQLKKLRTCPPPEFPRNLLPINKTSSGVKTLTVVASKSTVPSFTYKNDKKTKNNARVTVKDGLSGVMKVQRDGNFKTKNMTNLGTNILAKNANVSVVKNILERKKTLTQNRLHLERLKVLWKNIKMEKMIEDKCKNELKRLKIQQNFFELKISQQRTKIKNLAEESRQIYEAFQKMNKGLELIGKKKKIGSEILERKAESANISRKCSDVETVSNINDVPEPPKKEDGNLVEKIDGIVNLQVKTQQDGAPPISGNDTEKMKEYNSPLQRPSTGSESSTSQRVDPNTIMCQYDLTGRCNDEECPYQHFRA